MNVLGLPCFLPIDTNKANFNMKKVRPLRVGLFGIGLDAYWRQFKGLKQRLEGYVRVVQHKLERPGVEVVSLGLIDSVPRAFEAGHQFRAADVDLIFLHATTYALSSTVLPVVQRAKELGIRAALGASRGSLLGMVIRHAATLAMGGVVAGTALGLLFGQVLRALLYQVRATDPAAYLVAAGVVALFTLAASSVPAYKAARANPMEALRYE